MRGIATRGRVSQHRRHRQHRQHREPRGVTTALQDGSMAKGAKGSCRPGVAAPSCAEQRRAGERRGTPTPEESCVRTVEPSRPCGTAAGAGRLGRAHSVGTASPSQAVSKGTCRPLPLPHPPGRRVLLAIGGSARRVPIVMGIQPPPHPWTASCAGARAGRAADRCDDSLLPPARASNNQASLPNQALARVKRVS